MTDYKKKYNKYKYKYLNLLNGSGDTSIKDDKPKSQIEISTTVKIRELNETDDLDTIRSMWARYWQTTNPTKESFAYVEKHLKTDMKDIKTSNEIFMLALEDDKIIGFAGIYIDNLNNYQISKFTMDPNDKFKKVNKLLLENLIYWVKKNTTEKYIYVAYAKSNEYQKNIFSETGFTTCDDQPSDFIYCNLTINR